MMESEETSVGRLPPGWRNGLGTGAQLTPQGLVGLGLRPQVCGCLLWSQVPARFGGASAGMC